MSPIRRFRSLRARLTLWYAVAVAAILLVYAAGAYAYLRHGLYAELDQRLHDDVEAAEVRLARRSYDEVVLAGGSERNERDEDGPGPAWLEVWSVRGTRIAIEGPREPGETWPDALDQAPSRVGVETVSVRRGAGLRVRTASVIVGGAPVWIRTTRPEDRLRHELEEFLLGMGLGLPAAVLLACAGGYFLAGRAMRPVGRMAAQARAITAERLNERLPIENPDDELGRLGAVFNETLARLERSFESLRRFTADAAHELRTPLTALRSTGEVALRESTLEKVDREVVGSMLEEVDRLTGLVEALLLLSRADAGRVAVQPQGVDVLRFARDAAEYLAVLAEERHQEIVVEGDEATQARADPQLLRQAVFNLLDNAIEHSPEGAEIRMIVREASSEVVLEVIDRGPGIPLEHRERIFERFYRVDPARAREQAGPGGAGLGLSIALWAVRANGGSIEVESGEGEGSCFRIRLPAAHGEVPPGDSGAVGV